MRRWLALSPFTALFVATATLGQSSDAVRSIRPNPATGSAAAVLVEDMPLVHTAQLLPLDDAGAVAAPGDAPGQVRRLLARLDSALQAAGSDRASLVKLNWYVAQEELWPACEALLAAEFPGPLQPAMSLVATPLPPAGALVACDAVAAVTAGRAIPAIQRHPESAVMPAGSRIYVSGQAEPGNLREATRATLASLSATLRHCGRTDADVVELKCFLRPLQSATEVREEIERYFAPAAPPPVSYVEWKSTLPIEIELVAWGGPARSDAPQPLEFITPPGMKASPLFCRVVRIHRGGTIYCADLFGPLAGTAEQQAAQPFETLRDLLRLTGSDFAHLVKATYYVSSDEVSQAHNAVRPRFYDPARPPAASKALVAGTGRPLVRYVMDMIAVPAPPAAK